MFYLADVYKYPKLFYYANFCIYYNFIPLVYVKSDLFPYLVYKYLL